MTFMERFFFIDNVRKSLWNSTQESLTDSIIYISVVVILPQSLSTYIYMSSLTVFNYYPPSLIVS